MDGMFTLGIELGNDAMRAPADIVDALESVIQHMEDGCLTGGPISDRNGNTVGRWAASYPSTAQSASTLSEAEEAALAIIGKRWPSLADHLRRNPF